MADTLLIDGNALVTRAIMGAAREEVDLGLPFRGGVDYAFQTLAAIMTHHKLKPGRLVAFFDHSTPPRRLRLIPDYKSREKDLGIFESEEQRAAAMSQIDIVYRLMPLLGITTLCHREREADDGLAAAARVFIDRGESPIIVTGDKDLWQCVTWGARVWDLNKFELIHAGNFHPHTNVAPDTFLLWKGLVGDPSDNIKGALGFGKKTASALLEEAHWYVRATRGGHAQFEELIRFLRDERGILKRKPWSKAERQLIKDRKRIRRELRGIDLHDSFGPTKGLERRLKERPPVQGLAFVRACRKQGLKGVMPMFARPFERAAVRRDRKNEPGRGKKAR